MPLRCLKSLFALVLIVVSAPLSAQIGVWDHWKENKLAVEPRSANLPAAQRAALVKRIASRTGTDVADCVGEERKDLLEGLSFETIAVAPNRELILVEAGSGCARGGQGANGAMWLFRFEGSKPVLLACPEAGFEGWLFSVQKVGHARMPDIILGWHMSAAETNLTYFRFVRNLYRSVGSATLDRDGEGNETLTPEPPKP